MVQDLIKEREQVQISAIQEVSGKWGDGQTITGPYIAIPFDKYVRQSSKAEQKEELVKVRDWLYFLPQKLQVEGEMSPEKRYRGIYEVVVYESKFRLQGFFESPDFSSFEIDPELIYLDKASLNLGITDLKGIEKQISLAWNKQDISFNSGTSSKDIVFSGIHAPISLKRDSTRYHFEMDIDLKGSQHIFFVPVGKTTDVAITSNWSSPSFTGNYLPDEREITGNSFNSSWNILHLNRNYPQSWIGSQFTVEGSQFGVELLLPVDHFSKSHRVARYAILFLVLTFMVFFFVEVLNNAIIHPIQYLLVGVALVVFYILLLSISEHLPFNYAYIISSLATLSLVTAYTLAILKNRKVAAIIFFLLLVLYAFIYILIQLEDYALLIGSVGLFVILAIVMYFSRKIDWYEIQIGDQAEPVKAASKRFRKKEKE
jgi:inner membrane protein